MIAKVAEAAELTRKIPAAAVDAVFIAVTEFSAGEKVQLIGFGNFEVRKRAARKSRPQTGKNQNQSF